MSNPLAQYMLSSSAQDDDLRSEGEPDEAGGEDFHYSWESSQHGAVTVDDLCQILAERLHFVSASSAKNPSAYNRGDHPPPVDLNFPAMISYENLIDALDIELKKDPPIQHIRLIAHPPTMTNAQHHVPFFLAAVCLILRCSLLKRKIEVTLDPRYVGVPGTQQGLRCQLKKVIGPCDQVTPQDICNLYRKTLNRIMYLE